MTTIFIVIVGEDWNWTMYQWTRALSFYDNPEEPSSFYYWLSVFYFLALMIIGNITLFSLFTAILLQNFEADMSEKLKEKPASDSLQGSMNRSLSQRFFDKDVWSEFSEQFQVAFGKKKKKTRSRIVDSKQVEADQEASEQKLKEKASVRDEIEDPFKSARVDQPQGIFVGAGIIEAKQKKNARSHSLLHYDHSMVNKSMAATDQDTDISKYELDGKALCCFGEQNCLRRFCAKIVTTALFDKVILLLIVISTVTLALETPLDDPKGKLVQRLAFIDIFMTSAFTIEAILKIITFGFLFNGKRSYLKEPWNILDFVIVVSALVGIIGGDAINTSAIKAVRILRILRPLRIIAKDDGLKVAITSLFNSIPSIINLQIIVLFFIFLFAILQTTLFSGAFYRCHTEHLGLDLKQRQTLIEDQWDCINYGGEWVKPDLNFDDTLRSMLTLVTIQTTEGWIDVMWNSVDSRGPYLEP